MSSFKCDLMDVVLEWAEGSKFSDICKLTDIYEGKNQYLERNNNKNNKKVG